MRPAPQQEEGGSGGADRVRWPFGGPATATLGRKGSGSRGRPVWTPSLLHKLEFEALPHKLALYPVGVKSASFIVSGLYSQGLTRRRRQLRHDQEPRGRHLPPGRGARTYESLSSVCRVARAVSTSTPSSSDWTTGDSPPSPGACADGEDGGSARDAEGLGTWRVTSIGPPPASGPANTTEKLPRELCWRHLPPHPAPRRARNRRGGRRWFRGPQNPAACLHEGRWRQGPSNRPGWLLRETAGSTGRLALRSSPGTSAIRTCPGE